MSRVKRIKSEELLSGLIQRGSPRSDAHAVAGRLLKRHGSLAPVLESHAKDLMQAEGLSKNTAQLLSMIPQLARYLSRAELADAGEPIASAEAAGRYLLAQYIGVYYEQVYLLSLDRAGRLLECALVQQGTVDETPFYLRNILETAARAGAEAIVISHNHPGGIKHPSRADADSTLNVLKALSHLELILLDHIIIADGEVVSMHRDGPIPRGMFLAQDEDSGLLSNWVKI